MAIPLSLLDLAIVGADESVADALHGTVEVARHAESLGYRRVWYAEHHNFAEIASAATSVLIAHVAAHTTTIRLGAGGVMLPNHAPLTIAEQFGTLAELHPGRIELGLGRAPGTDQATLRALRRAPGDAEHFPDDVRELAGYLADRSLIAGVRAVPGAGTKVPLTILGSSTFGAALAAELGLPYGFASHFAPDALEAAVSRYRDGFQPSEQQPTPSVIAGINVIADHDEQVARERFDRTIRARVRRFYGRGRSLSDAEVDVLLTSPAGDQVRSMMRYHAVGTPAQVREQLEAFAAHADADELILVAADTRRADAMTTLSLVAEAMELEPAA